MGELYRLEFPNGKSYIGITKQTAAQRFARHVKKTRAGQRNAVNNAIQKYGVDAVRVVTLVVADWGYLCAAEKRAIEAFKTRAPRGYNLTAGGEGVPGLPCSPSTREKISKANSGRKLTDAQRAKISKALRMRGPVTEATRRKLSEAITGKTHAAAVRAKCGVANIGRTITEEAKAKQRATVLAKGGGVCFDARRGKWLAYVKVARKTKILGRFDTQEAARAARSAKIKEMYP